MLHTTIRGVLMNFLMLHTTRRLTDKLGPGQQGPTGCNEVVHLIAQLSTLRADTQTVIWHTTESES
jgi:hypothetical protein